MISANTSLIASLHEQVVVETVMLPQSTKDESASYRLGYALTAAWTVTHFWTYRNPSYRRAIREKYREPCNLPRHESALTFAKSSHCANFAVSLPRYRSQCQPFVSHVQFHCCETVASEMFLWLRRKLLPISHAHAEHTHRAAWKELLKISCTY